MFATERCDKPAGGAMIAPRDFINVKNSLHVMRFAFACLYVATTGHGGTEFCKAVFGRVAAGATDAGTDWLVYFFGWVG